jgi:hypothetical protein
VVLTRAFEKLPSASKAIHTGAPGLVALCTIFLMAPARDSCETWRAANMLILLAGEEGLDVRRTIAERGSGGHSRFSSAPPFTSSHQAV